MGRLLESEAATLAVGRELAATLEDGAVIGLIGNLGAGKTHLVKGLVAGLGSDEVVSSPTFSLVQEYTEGKIPVYHFDVYRLETAEELLEIGWDDYLDRSGIVIVEWAERFRELMPVGTQWLTLSHDAESGGRQLEGLS